MKICLKYRFPRKQEKRPSHRKERFSDFFTLALRQAQRPLLCLNRREAERLCSSSTNCCGSVLPVQARSRLSPCVVVAILQSLDFIDRKAVELGGNHLHVLRVIRALRLDGEEVWLGGELHELGLHFVPTSFRERSVLFFRAFPTLVAMRTKQQVVKCCPPTSWVGLYLTPSAFAASPQQ